MRRLKLIAALALTGAVVGACAAHPIVARDPVPPPTRSDVYDCDSYPTVVNAFGTECTPRRRAPRAVVRAAG